MNESVKVYICYGIAALCFLIGIIRMLYGLFWSSGQDPWYDYFVELIFLSFIGAMVLRLSRTFKK